MFALAWRRSADANERKIQKVSSSCVRYRSDSTLITLCAAYVRSLDGSRQDLRRDATVATEEKLKDRPS